MGHPTDPLMRVANSGTEATGKNYSNTAATPGFVLTSAGPDAVPIWAMGGTTVSVRFAVKLVTTQSLSPIPANAVVIATSVNIQSAYNVGTTIEIGHAGAPALLQNSVANVPQTPAQYLSPQDVDWGGTARVVVATVSGGPTVGTAIVRVDYVIPQP